MNITIVSKDAQLYRLCRELLADCLGIRCQLSVCASNGAPPAADLTIWDFYPELSLPEEISEEAEHRHLFLVHRKHLQSFRERLPLAPGILLKPVTRAALGAFLEQRMAQHEACPQATNRLGALRADRDEMLQSLMLANLRLQEYDQDRTTFLNRAVHDFRAPLTALSGYCGLLLAEQLGPLNEQQRDVLERALRSAKRHPTVQDDVIIYAQATILGGDTVIGTRAVIGGNTWITASVPPDTKVFLKQPELIYKGKVSI